MQNAATIDNIQKDSQKHIVPVNRAFASFPSYMASPLQIKELSHGNEIEVDNNDNSPVLFVYSPEEELVAVTENSSLSKYHPVKVFI